MQMQNDDQTAIRAELTAAATAAGIVDVADLAHVDVSTLKPNDAGADGVVAFVEALKVTRPHWFNTTPDVRKLGAAEYSAAKAAITRPLPVAPEPIADGRHARDLTEAEFRAARMRLTGRRW